MDALKTFETVVDGKKRTLAIYQDEDPQDPHDDENVIKFAFFHNHYRFPNDSGLSSKDYGSWEELREALHAKYSARVYMIDHSGLSFRVNTDFSDVDPGRWDSGCVGFVYITKKDAKENHVDKKKFLEWAVATVDTYDAYIGGNVYGGVEEEVVEVFHKDGTSAGTKTEHIDSCWGFYSLRDMADAFPDFKEILEKEAS